MTRQGVPSNQICVGQDCEDHSERQAADVDLSVCASGSKADRGGKQALSDGLLKSIPEKTAEQLSQKTAYTKMEVHYG